MDHKRGWVQQFHLGAMRNLSTRAVRSLGPDTGYDSVGDFPQGEALARLLDRLDAEGHLAKTIVYNLNPGDNELLATIVGSFQDGSAPGKMQLGSAWWFLDQLEGMTRQINALSNMGLLSRFVGMLTDSRSFLSYSRHEYFRRLLCNLLGDDVERGHLPDDRALLGRLVEDVCFRNARDYFDFERSDPLPSSGEGRGEGQPPWIACAVRTAEAARSRRDCVASRRRSVCRRAGSGPSRRNRARAE